MSAYARLSAEARQLAVKGGELVLRELEAGGWPQARNERWRYANIRSLDDVARFAPTGDSERPSLTMPPPAVLQDFRRLCLYNGRWLPAWSDDSLRPEPVPARTAGGGFERIAQLFQPQELGLTLGDGARVELLHLHQGSGGSYARLAIDIAAGAQVRLVERHLAALPDPLAAGQPPPAAVLLAPVLQLRLAPGASLALYRLQQTATAARWYDTMQFELAADSRCQLRQLSLGGHAARSSVSARLAGAGAELTVHALAVGNGQQTHDLSLDVVHAAPRCHSSQVFRGLAAGRARVAVSADVQVEPAGAGADVTQSLKGLIENAGAEIDLRPRLTILTDDVKARHGATTGQLDQQLLFYLLSRGIERGPALGLLKWAFLGDVLGAVDLPALRGAAAQAIAGHLGSAWLAEAAL